MTYASNTARRRVYDLVARYPGQLTRRQLAIHVYGSDDISRRRALDVAIYRLRKDGERVIFDGTYTIAKRTDMPRPKRMLVKPFVATRNGKKWSPPRGPFTARHEKVLVLLHEYYELGGATAADIAGVLWKNPTTANVHTVHTNVIPYIVAKGAVIERISNKYRIVELP